MPLGSVHSTDFIQKRIAPFRVKLQLLRSLQARIIYEDYVSILSPREVRLDSRVREIINRNMIAPSQGRRRSTAHCGGGESEIANLMREFN